MRNRTDNSPDRMRQAGKYETPADRPRYEDSQDSSIERGSNRRNYSHREDLRGNRYLSTDYNDYAFGGSGLEGERYDNPTAFPPAPVKTYSGLGPRNYKRSDDRLREDLSDRLTDHREIDASNIEVSVMDGNVKLSGSVPDKRMKYAAEDIAEKLHGVKAVDNQIRVLRNY